MIAKTASHPEPIGHVVAGSDHRHERCGWWQRHLLLLHGKDGTIETDPEADPRRRASAKQLDQGVVPAATPDGLLLSLASGDEELERGAGVVVEAAHEPMVDHVADAQRIEEVQHPSEVSAAVVAQVIGAARGGGPRQLGR